MRYLISVCGFTMAMAAGFMPSRPAAQAPPAGRSLPVYDFTIVNSYPHDRAAFTEGLLFHDGVLYESTGEEGRSWLRKVQLETGKVLQQHDLAPQYFGEGMIVWKSRIYQLTWKSGVAFIYDKDTFAPKGTFNYKGEGWSLTHDGTNLYMSDGTNALRVLNPETFAERRRITVTANGVPIKNELVNELEFVKGEILANMWQTDYIARIDPKTGKIMGYIDLTGLLSPSDRASGRIDVLNGIAYDAAKDRLFVTGKWYPRLFEIKIGAVKKGR